MDNDVYVIMCMCDKFYIVYYLVPMVGILCLTVLLDLFD